MIYFDAYSISATGEIIATLTTVIFSFLYCRSLRSQLDNKYRAQIEEQKQYILSLIFKLKE